MKDGLDRRSRPQPRELFRARLWKNLFQGQPAFLIGNGCSAGDCDLTLLRDHFTIGINRAFYLLDPTILMWQDISLLSDNRDREGIRECRAVKVCRDIADPHNEYFHFRLRTADGFRLATEPHVLYGIGASGPLAYQMAFAMGFEPIVLIGFDCKYRDGKTDFYGSNRFHRPATLTNCSRGLRWINESSRSHCRRTINCSDNDVFESSSSLERVIAELHHPGAGAENHLAKLLGHNP